MRSSSENPSGGGRNVLVWLLLCLIWSSTWMAIKVGLHDLPPVSFAAIRFVIAAGVLFGACAIWRIPVTVARPADYFFFARTGLLTFTVNYGLLFWGEQHISSGLAAVFQATIPLFGMLFGHWCLPDEPMRLRAVLGTLLGFMGVGYICSNVLSLGGKVSLLGGLAIILGAASAAYSNVLVKKRGHAFAPALVAAWQMLFGAIPLLAVGLWREGNPAKFAWNRVSLGCLMYLALVGSSLAFLLYYWLMRRIALNKLQAISLIIPPLALVFGWRAAGEPIPLSTWSGAVLVLVGLGMIFRRQPAGGRHGQRENSAVPVRQESQEETSEAISRL